MRVVVLDDDGTEMVSYEAPPLGKEARAVFPAAHEVLFAVNALSETIAWLTPKHKLESLATYRDCLNENRQNTRVTTTGETV